MTKQKLALAKTKASVIILDRVKSHCPRDVGDKPIKGSDSFADNLCLDSLDIAELMLEIEIALDVVIEDKDIVRLKSIDDVLSYLTPQLQRKT